MQHFSHGGQTKLNSGNQGALLIYLPHARILEREKKKNVSVFWVLWHMTIISALSRWEQKNQKFVYMAWDI